jgi:hypothetical protein
MVSQVSYVALNLVSTDNSVTITKLSNGNTNLQTAGGGGTPASPTTAVQFNNAGSFGGDAGFTFTGTGTSGNLTVGNVTGVTSSTGATSPTLTVQTGAPTATQDGGALTVKTANTVAAAKASGAVTISTGTASGGTGGNTGNLTISTGTTAGTGTAGSINIVPGTTASATKPAVNVGGSGLTTISGSTGVTLTSSKPINITGTGSSGTVNVTTGSSGALNITCGGTRTDNCFNYNLNILSGASFAADYGGGFGLFGFNSGAYFGASGTATVGIDNNGAIFQGFSNAVWARLDNSTFYVADITSVTGSINLKPNTAGDLYTPSIINVESGHQLDFQAHALTIIGIQSTPDFSDPPVYTKKLGFYGTTPVAKPTVTGSRATGAALVSLLTQLASLGLITDSTTT